MSCAVFNPTGPQFGYRMTRATSAGRRSASASTGPKTPTYTYQLHAFLAAVVDGVPPLTPPADSVANMEVVDAIYRASGLGVREPTPVR